MPGKRASPRRTQQVGCLGLWPGVHHKRLLDFVYRPRKRRFRPDRTYRLVVPRPSLEFSGPGEGQRPDRSPKPGSGPDDLSIGPTDHAVRQLAFDPPSVPTDDTVRQLGLTLPSVQQTMPPNVPLVGGGQSAATGKFRSTKPRTIKARCR
jgi:hypothetical protein